MKREIEFRSGPNLLRGWLETADDASGPLPAICFSHGFSGLKELFLDAYSTAFAAAGFACVVWDHPNFGDSEGEPRYEVDPPAQVRGYRDAITFAAAQDEVDADRIGIWGTSYSGGHVIQVAALDPRVQALACQVPFISGWANSRRVFREEEQAGLSKMFVEDWEARQRGEEPAKMDVFGPAGSLCALPSPEEFDWVTNEKLIGTPLWENVVTLRSVEMMAEYEPGSYVGRVRAPLLMVITALDDVTPADIAQDCFAQAREPKKLVVLKGGHMEVYGAQSEYALGQAIEWFGEHLAG
ncbi:MAG: uncharacterized protein QOG62_2608 [Thermoleophilaceae bacterium]|jgi:fermentation-respiration switch protein FrsA (DUF1100 family)|nr:uncharacterized protein [Thermoleophilaceae bacterium]